MKTLYVSVLLSMGMIVCMNCTNAPESDEAKTTDAKEVNQERTGEVWKLNITESKIEWIGTKVSGYHTGTIPLKSGEIFVDNSEVTGGRFVMDAANIVVSGPKNVDEKSSKKLEGHLKSADFFDVEKYPEATFELTNVKPYRGVAIKDTTDPRQDEISEYKVANPTHVISGNLTMKGVSKNIEFPAQITVSGNSAEAIAKFNIDRRDWNIVYPGQPDDLIRDHIHLGISIKAAK
jgi:polyisoprenoid-binding protein YceI